MKGTCGPWDSETHFLVLIYQNSIFVAIFYMPGIVATCFTKIGAIRWTLVTHLTTGELWLPDVTCLI